MPPDSAQPASGPQSAAGRRVEPGAGAGTEAQTGTELGIARAVALFERMDPAQAVAALEPVLAADPSSVEGWNLMARLRLALDENAVALDAATKAVALDPENARALATASRALSQMGRHDEAVTMAYRAVVVEPVNPQWHDRVAWALLAADRGFADAEQAARTAIGLDPNEPHYYFTHGVALESLGHLDQARQALLTSLRMNPENSVAQHRLAVLNGEATRDPEPKKRGFKLFGRKKG
ncbi:tetratricopeptide repeat protein [Actinoplanes sp. CA-030573]|uniref:tetratricopeptide repeat protein n=1 Tax=Actinoplanes sp. CA-030573 TaxID=3239898 RepID=UPI003D8A252C